jgi:release factor glutamine methyltransferase
LKRKIDIDFSEINPIFIKQIKKNLKINFPEKKFEGEIYQSDIFENIPKNNLYDFIFANPPYIPKKKINILDKSVKDFEDHNSLFAEDDGLFFIKKIILESKKFLKIGGKVFIEFDEGSKKQIILFLKENKIGKLYFQKDQFQNDRLLIIERKD